MSKSKSVNLKNVELTDYLEVEAYINKKRNNQDLLRKIEKVSAARSLQLFKPVDSSTFPIGNYIYLKTGRIAERMFEVKPSGKHSLDAKTAVQHLVDCGFTLISRSDDWENDEGFNSSIFTYEKETPDGLMIAQIETMVDEDGEEKAIYRSTCLVHCVGKDNDFDAVIDRIKKAVKKVDFQANNIHLVISTPRGYDTIPFELPKTKLDIELNYGNGFLPVHEKILQQLTTTKGKGLVLLHSTPGTGKTHYLKYLASQLATKKVMFVPPYLTEFMTSPEMIPFLIENSDSILFIEDAERVITDRTINGGAGVSNILNLTDGILSDILNIQVVATFNMDKQKIDTALLRKGRLIAEHKFEALPMEDAQRLIEHLGIDWQAKGPMTLTEIYNVRETEYKSETRAAIGFGR